MAAYSRSLVQQSCESVLTNLRSSSLNYSVLETPFSLYLTVRKSLQKSYVATPKNVVEALEEAKVSKQNERVTFLEKANDELKFS